MPLRKFFCCAGLLILLSCSPEKPAELKTQKPQEAAAKGVSGEAETHAIVSDSSYSLSITPAQAYRGSTLSLIPIGFNLSDAKIEWLVNGNPVISEFPSQFKAAETKKGDTVQAKAMLKDREILSGIVKVKNTLPVISKVKIMPETFKAGDTLYVDVTGSDIDGDEVAILYEWTKNGEPAGKEKQIGVPIKRGDKISVKITPFDGEGYGKPFILNSEIRNLPPVIIEDKNSLKPHFDGNNFSYQVKAIDPDNDTLTYSLKTAPSGMTIEKTTGLIQWTVPQDFKGKVSVTFIVNDGHGGEALQSFAFELTTTR
ncbi:MAG: Ig-like domain-containing protein [Nitrospirae bacterium]|nr:Ig-like domain-containing protein [Nitrospirota bacterium]